MKLNEYLQTQFPKDLNTLKYEKPNPAIKSSPDLFRIDNNTIYFGGPEWKNIGRDISNIDTNNLEYFFICLFTITIIDLTIFTYYNDRYEVFRSKTMYPKFGWSSFGPHYENPKKLLLIPHSHKIVNFNRDPDFIKEYVDLFINECNTFFTSVISGISTKDFIGKILNDNDMQLSSEESDSILGDIIKYLHTYE